MVQVGQPLGSRRPAVPGDQALLAGVVGCGMPGLVPSRGLRHLSRARVSLVVLILAAVAVPVALYFARSSGDGIQLTGQATVVSASLDSTSGRDLLQQFESLGGTRATRDAGPAVFLTMNWAVDHKVELPCQVQLAVHAGSGWQLFGWAGNPRVINGTINSWGSILAKFPELRTYQDTITLPSADSGQVMLVWSAPSFATEVDSVRARLVYACGGDGKSPVIQEVKITSRT